MKTITLEDDEFNEVCDLLQLLTVVGIKLWMQGRQPNLTLLAGAFDKFARHGMEQYVQADNTLRDVPVSDGHQTLPDGRQRAADSE